MAKKVKYVDKKADAKGEEKAEAKKDDTEKPAEDKSAARRAKLYDFSKKKKD